GARVCRGHDRQRTPGQHPDHNRQRRRQRRRQPGRQGPGHVGHRRRAGHRLAALLPRDAGDRGRRGGPGAAVEGRRLQADRRAPGQVSPARL
ncbi:MAG: hypothetical protein AVDCRST_MAG47-1132, partial [uncultured Nocardioidaceae bacterium]